MEAGTRRLILKIMVLLYQSYKDKLGALKTLPFWLRFIENPSEADLHFLALQIILAALYDNRVYEQWQKREIAQKVVEANFKLFEDLDGLRTIVGCLNFGYKEIKNIQRFKTWVR